ncbi:MAG: hypothetical protein H7Y12_04020 [Sphingobacteriaceae bacterium]|nr:hypothetical protein [Cytophagaceae bacterium]
MSQYLIDVPDEKIEEVASILETLNVKMAPVEERKPDIHKALDALRRIRDAGGIPSIPDPSAWQREIRKDKPLYGREE